MWISFVPMCMYYKKMETESNSFLLKVLKHDTGLFWMSLKSVLCTVVILSIVLYCIEIVGCCVYLYVCLSSKCTCLFWYARVLI